MKRRGVRNWLFRVFIRVSVWCHQSKTWPEIQFSCQTCQVKLKRSRILIIPPICFQSLLIWIWLNLICTRIMKLSLILEKMFSWIHPQDLSWVYVFCWGMLMQGKHTLCVPPLWLTVKDIENREDQGVNIMNKTPKSCDQLISYATIILWTST